MINKNYYFYVINAIIIIVTITFIFLTFTIYMIIITKRYDKEKLNACRNYNDHISMLKQL